MNNISENLFQSIDTIISQRLNEVQFDITVTGEVVDSSEAERGIYRVKSDNIEFSATGEPSRYVNGAQVYITIPKGNYNNDKIIVGVVAKDVIAPLRYLRPMDYIIPFEKVNLSNINNFKETVAWNWKYLCLSTNINGNPISNYGLELWINDKLIGRFDSMEFFGDPYNPMGMNQQKLFKTNEPIISIEVRPYGDINAEFTDVIIAAGTPQEDETELERLVIARVDAPSVEVSANDEIKIQAYHVHKDSTGLYVADKVFASWYRYRDGTYNFGAGASWGPIQSINELELNAPNTEVPWTIGWSKQDKETIITYQLDKFPVEKAESIKAVLGSLESNTLTLISEQGQVQIDKDGNVIDFSSRELIVTINGKTNSTYNVYGMDNEIISNPGKQTLEVKFADGTSAEGIEFEYIYPNSEDSMIIPIKEISNNEEKITNSFNLRSTYFPTYDSNTIIVKANVNGYIYKGTITSTFGYQDNNGTQYRFNARYENRKIIATLQDNSGNYFDMTDICSKLTADVWSAEGYHNLSEPKNLDDNNNTLWDNKINKTQAELNYDSAGSFGVLQIKLENWGTTMGDINLTTYIVINSTQQYTLDGATRIVYAADGMSASYDDRIYTVKDSEGNVIESTITFTFVKNSSTGYTDSDQQVMSIENDRPVLNYPAPLQKNNVIIMAKWMGQDGNSQSFITPVLCITNAYSNELLNSWSEKTIVDKEGNYIMSSLVGAGSKHEDNSFSGVLMGKVGNAETGSSYGIYGYNTGVQRFKLDANGNLLIKGNDDNYITLDELGNLNFNLNSIAFDVSDDSSGDKFELRSSPLGHQNYLFLGSTKPGESYIQFDAYGNLSFNFESIEGKIGKMSLTINSLNTKIEDLNAEIKNLTLTAENANIKAGNTEGQENYKLIINTSATGNATLFQVGSGDDMIKMSGNGELTVELTSLDATIEDKVRAEIGTLELTAKHINVTTDNFTLNTKQPQGTSGIYDVFKVNKGNHNVSFKSDGSFTINSLYFDISDNGLGTIAGWSFNNNTLSAPTSKDALQRTLISTGTGSSFNLPTGGSKKDLVFGAGEFDTTKNETKPFMVFKDGSLYASNAHITGEITATSGKIGKNNTAWFISENGLKYEDNSNYVATEVIFISGYQYVITWSSLEIKPYSFTINIGINKTYSGSTQQNNSKYTTEKQLLAAYGFTASSIAESASTTLDIPWTRFVNAAYDN